MKAVIFTTEKKAQDFNNILTDSVKNLFDENTTAYSYVMKHPLNNSWCVPIDENGKFWNVIKKQNYKLETLSSDWFPKNDII